MLYHESAKGLKHEKVFYLSCIQLFRYSWKKSYRQSHINHIFMYDVLVIYPFAIQL